MKKTSKWLGVNVTCVELKLRMLDDTYNLNNSQTLDPIMTILMANSYLEEAPQCYGIGSSKKNKNHDQLFTLSWLFCDNHLSLGVFVFHYISPIPLGYDPFPI